LRQHWRSHPLSPPDPAAAEVAEPLRAAEGPEAEGEAATVVAVLTSAQVLAGVVHLAAAVVVAAEEEEDFRPVAAAADFPPALMAAASRAAAEAAGRFSVHLEAVAAP
jgi:hypothetical protein